MWKRLLRLARHTRHEATLDKFDPVYGLAKEAIDEWLSRNPALKQRHEAELTRRGFVRTSTMNRSEDYSRDGS
jgi:hypothetical protein